MLLFLKFKTTDNQSRMNRNLECKSPGLPMIAEKYQHCRDKFPFDARFTAIGQCKKKLGSRILANSQVFELNK